MRCSTARQLIPTAPRPRYRRTVARLGCMPRYRISEASHFLNVSDDTLRRWIDAGRLSASTDDSGRRVVDGVELAHLAQEIAGGISTPEHT